MNQVTWLYNYCGTNKRRTNYLLRFQQFLIEVFKIWNTNLRTGTVDQTSYTRPLVELSVRLQTNWFICWMALTSITYITSRYKKCTRVRNVLSSYKAFTVKYILTVFFLWRAGMNRCHKLLFLCQSRESPLCFHNKPIPKTYPPLGVRLQLVRPIFSLWLGQWPCNHHSTPNTLSEPGSSVGM